MVNKLLLGKASSC